MVEPIKTPIICPNGHQQPNAGSKFCIYCGTALNASSVQPQYAQNNYQQPNQIPAYPQPPAQQPLNQQYQQQNPPVQNNQQPPVSGAPQAYNQNYQPQFQPPAPVIQPIRCFTCGGDGQGLDAKTIICKECRWLRPLASGYGVDPSAFQWAADGRAMNALRSIKPLNAAAQAVSEKIGRRWIETTFNGVLLGENQLPEIYVQAVKAARILGMTHMPDVYLSGERAWDCLTFGSDRDCFIVIGSALAGNFRGPDMFFLMAREMGHCRAGHALWNSVIRFLLGEQGNQKGMMAGGVFKALMNPLALIEGAVEVPLLAWARQSEITADRAGLLTVGDEQIARRVLLSWSLKSSFMYKQINIEAWLAQQSAEESNNFSRLSELTTSSTPYITRRLQNLSEFARSPELQRWRQLISGYVKQIEPPAPAGQEKAAAKDVMKIKCATCAAPMQIPLKVLEGKKELPVKCPKCGKINSLKRKTKPADEKAIAPKPKKQEENMNYGD
jgi:Zn-dependent protease with chaperone function